ncbi:MAG: exo-alpha-sialidase [Clostridia bacterium]|nr:exo-alpha-sialidase [Clostridia bacterium]
MNDLLKIMEQSLSESDIRLLKSIYEPTVVGIPAEDARRSLVVMPDGELRCYGRTNKKVLYNLDDGDMIYLSSRDCGLSWKTVFAPKGAMGDCTYDSKNKRFITIRGKFAYISEIGPDDTAPRKIKIADKNYFDMFQPVKLSCGRWLCSGQLAVDKEIDGKIRNNYCSVVFRSDDDGETWDITELKSAPRFEVVWPHKSLRWENNGSECSLTELPDGRIMLISRTSQDYFYVYYSSDNGETWTDGEPSPFHGTLTTPFLLKLSDGRILHFWNNTQPLAEIDKKNYWPKIEQPALDGLWEDVFTNRDINHAAISEDGGKSWLGFRELGLNEIRNASDFRSAGGMYSSADKSVHQFQAIELPFGKVLVAYGQHQISRRFVIFDVDWLYEKSRTETFRNGLKDVTTHVYVKSVCESQLGHGYPGHCAWNRTNGALLVPDPEGNCDEALQISRIDDPRLVSQLQGVVWNFPAMKKGKIEIDIRIEGEGLRLSLTDRWFNAADEYIWYYAQFTTEIDNACIEKGKWTTVTVHFDTEAKFASVEHKGEKIFDVKMKDSAPNGISYLHLQTLAKTTDPKGSYLHRLHAEAE